MFLGNPASAGSLFAWLLAVCGLLFNRFAENFAAAILPKAGPDNLEIKPKKRPLPPGSGHSANIGEKGR
jgi:hypothetical protein